MIELFPEFDELEAMTDHSLLTNDFVGDHLHEINPTNITRIYCQNINGLTWDSEGGKWPYICEVMAGIHASIACFIETNTDTNKVRIRQQMETIASRQFQHNRLIMATSKHQTSTNYKPGGTAILACNTITSMIKSHSRDRMGRWTSMQLATSPQRSVRIITAYQVCANSQPGTNTAFAQQFAQIIEENALTTNATRISPRASFIGDLHAFIRQCQGNGEDIILLGDFNEEITERNAGMEEIARNCNLADLFSVRLGNPSTPATYQRGSKRIDYVLLSPSLLEHVSAAGYDPFGYRVPSDHRGFFVDFYSDALFTHELTPLAQAEKRDFTSKSPGVIPKYVRARMRYLKDHRFFERLETLKELSHPDPILAEALDRDFQRSAIHAASQCAKRQQVPWSPQLAEAWAELHFFRVLNSARTTNKNYDAAISRLQQQWDHLPKQTPTTEDAIKQGYNSAMQKLREAQQQARSLREEYLLKKAALYDSLEDKGKTKILHRLIRAETQHKVYKKIQYLRHQDDASAGLASIKVPKDPTITDPNIMKQLPDNPHHWETITTPGDIERRLLHRNQSHFGQAEGTPFTQEPIRSDIGFHGDGYAAELILQGQLTYPSVDEATKLLIGHLKEKTQEKLSGIITKTEIRGKLKRWNESTSTSPSGIHLGHYHCLWRRPYSSDEDERQKVMENQEELIQALETLLNYALKFGYAYTRWTKVVNVMLQKDPGNPRIHRLRVIHLYEADYNMLLAIKWRQAIHNAEDMKLLNEGMYGSRPGRSAHDPALIEVLQHETYRMSMKSGINFDLDATSCYDRILASIAAMSSRRLGVANTVTLMNTNMLEDARYHLKTSLGVSLNHYRHTVEHPIHGTGQGSGNSPALWCFVCSLLFDAFQSVAHGAQFSSYDKSINQDIHMIGFVDDCTQRVNQFQESPQPSPETLINLMQSDAQLWNNLLWSSGGALEQSKCSFHLIQSSWTQDGHPFLTGGSMRHTISLQHQSQTTQTHQKSNYEPHKTLGCYISPAKCDKTTWTKIQAKNNEFANLLETNVFTRHEAWTFYTSVYLPSMSYPLPITPLTKPQCNRLDARFLRTLLPRCGYNRNMPSAIRYAPFSMGGAGFKQLYVEQGALLVQQIFKFFNHPQSQVGKMLFIALSWTQAFLGISQPILEEVTHATPPAGPSIILDLRDFLRDIGGHFIIQQEYTSPTLRENDQHIMDLALYQNRWNRRQLIQINSCRRYIQAQTLADITNPLGTRIINEAYSPRNPPSVTRTRIAQFNQQRPAPVAWRTWRRFLRTISDTYGVLRIPLRNWIKTHDTLRQWPKHVYDPSTDNLYQHCHDNLYQPFVRRSHGVFEVYLNGQLQVIKGYPTAVYQINGTMRAMKNFTVSTSNEPPRIAAQQVPSFQHLQDWERNLLQHVTWHADPEFVQQQLTNGNMVACSDGSASRNTGTYGYILSTTQGQRLVRGKGPSPGAFPNSFRSEAYGILAAMRMITRLLKKCYPLPAADVAITHWLDNQSVIHRVKSSMDAKYSTANQQLQPEQDVIQEVARTIVALPIKVNLKWVQGHQDRTRPYNSLTLEAQLNCEADKEAADFVNSDTNHSQTVPPLPHTNCQFVIQGLSITNKYKSRIHHAAQKRNLHDYTLRKFAWDPETPSLIDWDVFTDIIMKYSDRRTTIVKHIHDISPTGTIAHRNDPLLPHACPACHEPYEDNRHVIICSHASRRQWRSDTMQHLRHKQDPISDPYLQDILQDGLTRYHNNYDHIPNGSYPQQYAMLIDNQNKIGWDQLYKGRWALSWAQLHDDYRHGLQDRPTIPSGNEWVTSTGRLLIDRWLHLWKLRNEQRHNSDQEHEHSLRKQRIIAELNELYSLKNMVCPSDRQIFHESIHDHTTRHPSITALEDWISTHRHAIKASIEQAKRLGIQQNRSIYRNPTLNPSSQADG